MRLLVAVLSICTIPAIAAEPVQFDVEGAHVIVIRPVDAWDPNTTTSKYALESINDRGFVYSYMDASGNKILPRSGGIFSSKVATPVSDEVDKIVAAAGFRPHVNYVYDISAPVTLDPAEMVKFTEVQNGLYRAWSVRQGDPAQLESRASAARAFNVLATVATAGFGVKAFGLDAVNLSQYGTLYGDIAKLTSGTSTALLPLPLPAFDFSTFSSVEVRRVADNADHVGEIVIAYRQPKTESVERVALARGIAAVAGAGLTVQDVQEARRRDYAQRVTFWSECQASSICQPK
jgi:hypothetical protein